MKTYKPIILLMIVVVFSSPLWAEDKFAQPIRLFDEATLVNEERVFSSSYLLALGPYEKVGNRWQAETKQRITGYLLRQTHELPRRMSEVDAFAFYTEALGSSTILYQCEGFNCGASNNWANVHFSIRELYGLDRHQYLQVAQLANGDFATIYVVRRGNRRVLAQIELMRPSL